MQTIFGIIWIYFGRGRFHSFYGLVAAASYFARSCLDWRYKQYIHNNHRIWPRNCWLNAWWSNSSKDLPFIYWGQIHWDCGRLPLDPSRDHFAWRKFWITIIPRVLQKWSVQRVTCPESQMLSDSNILRPPSRIWIRPHQGLTDGWRKGWKVLRFLTIIKYRSLAANIFQLGWLRSEISEGTAILFGDTWYIHG